MNMRNEGTAGPVEPIDTATAWPNIARSSTVEHVLLPVEPIGSWSSNPTGPRMPLPTSTAVICSGTAGDAWSPWMGDHLARSMSERYEYGTADDEGNVIPLDRDAVIDHVVPGRKVNPGKPLVEHVAWCGTCGTVHRCRNGEHRTWTCSEHGDAAVKGCVLDGALDDGRPAVTYGHTVTRRMVAVCRMLDCPRRSPRGATVEQVKAWTCKEHGHRVRRYGVSEQTSTARIARGGLVRFGAMAGAAGNPVRPAPTDRVTVTGRWSPRTAASPVDDGKVLVYRWSTLAMAHGPWTKEYRHALVMPTRKLPLPIRVAPVPMPTFVIGSDGAVLDCRPFTRTARAVTNITAAYEHVGTVEHVRPTSDRLPVEPSAPVTRPTMAGHAPTSTTADMSKLRRGGYLMRVENSGRTKVRKTDGAWRIARTGAELKQAPTAASLASLIARDANVRPLVERVTAARKVSRSAAARTAAIATHAKRGSAADRAARKMALATS